jgi:hypothetical protein
VLLDVEPPPSFAHFGGAEAEALSWSGLVLEQHLIILLENGQMRSRQSKLLNFDVVLIFPPGATRSVVTGYSMRLVLMFIAGSPNRKREKQ